MSALILWDLASKIILVTVTDLKIVKYIVKLCLTVRKWQTFFLFNVCKLLVSIVFRQK